MHVQNDESAKTVRPLKLALGLRVLRPCVFVSFARQREIEQKLWKEAGGVWNG